MTETYRIILKRESRERVSSADRERFHHKDQTQEPFDQDPKSDKNPKGSEDKLNNTGKREQRGAELHHLSVQKRIKVPSPTLKEKQLRMVKAEVELSETVLATDLQRKEE